MKTFEATGKTYEEALMAGLAQMGLPSEKVDVEVLEEGTKGFLGIGAKPYKLLLTKKDTPAIRAEEFLKNVTELMGLTVTFEITETEEALLINMQGDNQGILIGHRGETLDALQYLAGLVSNRVDNSYYRITLDIGNYREKREQTLIALAKKVAGQASRTGRRTSLEPMNPYERRIIHTAVQEVEGATSWSVGSEPNRHVMIGPSDDNPVKNRPAENKERSGGSRGRGRGGRREGRNREEKRDNAARTGVSPERPARQIRQFIPRSNPLPTADGATPPSRTESETESSATLYGRIDL